jgi:hypothetical protein
MDLGDAGQYSDVVQRAPARRYRPNKSWTAEIR